MSKKGIVLAVASAALFTSGCDTLSHMGSGGMSYGSGGSVKCQGVNSCKGQSECQTATNACKGQNSCKGHGWQSMSESECINWGGLSVDR